MKQQFINYEHALKLKDLGYKERCLGYYAGNNLITSVREPYYPDKVIKAPLYQQAIQWLLDGIDYFKGIPCTTITFFSDGSGHINYPIDLDKENEIDFNNLDECVDRLIEYYTRLKQ